jgi:hypothetical protein
VQELLSVLVLDGDRVEIPDFWKLAEAHMVEAHMVIELNTPCELRSSSLPCRVSWNAGLIKLSPGPEYLRILKWIQKNERYSMNGQMMSPIAR